MLPQQSPAPGEGAGEGRKGRVGCRQGDGSRLTGAAAVPLSPLPQEPGAAPSSTARLKGSAGHRPGQPSSAPRVREG